MRLFICFGFTKSQDLSVFLYTGSREKGCDATCSNREDINTPSNSVALFFEEEVA